MGSDAEPELDVRTAVPAAQTWAARTTRTKCVAILCVPFPVFNVGPNTLG